MRLSAATLSRVAARVARPAYDVSALGCGIVHLGLGAFHRAHQALYTDAAIAEAGGAWGIVGVSMRSPAVADALDAQGGLYAVETLDAAPAYRVVGSVRRALTLAEQPDSVLDALAAPETRIVTLTVTEKGYHLDGSGALDLAHPEIAHDLARPQAPRTAVGALAAGLARRLAEGAGPVTVISCDNLAENGRRLGEVVRAFAARAHPALAARLDAIAAFPETMVDSIVPASDAAHRARVAAALGLEDEGSVQREAFGQWVIEDRFAGPRPAWDRVGAEIVEDVASHRRMKLHGLNAAHSALAYLGLARGFTYVREAVADPALAAFMDEMVETEVAPALPDLPVARYWTTVRRRFANPAVDHRLDQIAQDGVHKLAERVYPLMLANARAGAPVRRLAEVVRAWMDWTARTGASRPDLGDPSLFPAEFRHDSRIRGALLDAGP